MRPMPRDEVLALHELHCGETATYDERPMQLGLCCDPWRVIVGSIMLNCTRHTQARPALRELLDKWPGPSQLAEALIPDVEEVVRPCGFGDRRAKILLQLARAWVAGHWLDVRDLPGVGIYVADAVGVFCFDEIELDSSDKRLAAYVLEKQKS